MPLLTLPCLGVKQTGVSFEVLVHLGTLLSVLVYFRARIFRLIAAVFDSSRIEDRRWIWLLIIGTIPAGLAGVLLKDFFERAFSNPVMTSVMLLVTGAILISTRFARSEGKKMSWLAR